MHLLQPAIGFLELGMAADALEELDGLPGGLQDGEEVLSLRVSAHGACKEWGRMRDIAESLVARWPEDAGHWISLAYATRRCRDIGQAEVILLEALARHESEAMIHYNLACYAAQTERALEAMERLKRAMDIEPAVKGLAMEDPDLLPVWHLVGRGRPVE